MNISNYYWYFKSALTPKFCDEVIKYGLSQKKRLATVGDYFKDEDKYTKEEITDLKRKRYSNVAWLNTPWIYKEIHPYLYKANKSAGWNFQLSRSQTCQFTQYKLNQYYGWHCDSSPKPYDKPKDTDYGKIRKLSMTCQLTDSSEYSGGELEFDFRNYDPHMRDESKHRVQCKEILPKGSIIVFPSFVWHRVKPVKKGKRYSLVTWTVGEPFK